MKRINKIFGLSLSLAAVFGLASCSNEVGEPANTPDNNSNLPSVKLVKTPEVVAYSGSTTYGNTTKGYWWNEEESKYYYQHDEEVEVNLSVNDIHDKYDVADLVAKLSIHVRNASNVTVTLPLPTGYLVESDDLYIFNQHYLNDDTHQGAYGTALVDYLVGEDGEKINTHSLSYTIPVIDGETTTNATVGLTITFNTNNTVTVETSGITDKVLASCLDYNHDGMNFEVYLYLQTEEAPIEALDLEDTEEPEDVKAKFKTALNGSTVSFTGTPKYYINAFGYKYFADGTHNLEMNPYDCTVDLVSSLKDSYQLVANPTEKNVEHLNGTPYNYIYLLKGEGNKADHAHGGIDVDDPNEVED